MTNDKKPTIYKGRLPNGACPPMNNYSGNDMKHNYEKKVAAAPVEPSVKERVRRFRAKLGKSNICDFQELRELLQDVYNELDDLDNADQELQDWAAALDADEEYIAACSGGQVISVLTLANGVIRINVEDNPF